MIQKIMPFRGIDGLIKIRRSSWCSGRTTIFSSQGPRQGSDYPHRHRLHGGHGMLQSTRWRGSVKATNKCGGDLRKSRRSCFRKVRMASGRGPSTVYPVSRCLAGWLDCVRRPPQIKTGHEVVVVISRSSHGQSTSLLCGQACQRTSETPATPRGARWCINTVPTSSTLAQYWYTTVPAFLAIRFII